MDVRTRPKTRTSAQYGNYKEEKNLGYYNLIHNLLFANKVRGLEEMQLLTANSSKRLENLLLHGKC